MVSKVGILISCSGSMSKIYYQNTHFVSIEEGTWVFLNFSRNVKNSASGFIIWQVINFMLLLKATSNIFYQDLIKYLDNNFQFRKKSKLFLKSRICIGYSKINSAVWFWRQCQFPKIVTTKQLTIFVSHCFMYSIYNKMVILLKCVLIFYFQKYSAI